MPGVGLLGLGTGTRTTQQANHAPSPSEWGMRVGAVKSSQGLLFSEARKPCAEAAGHGRRGWCARVWSPPPPGLSKESGER